MSTDYHLRLTASDGSQAVITIADSIRGPNKTLC